MSLAAGGAAAAAMAVAEAQGVQAKPVAVLHDLKGKGRALVSRGQDSWSGSPSIGTGLAQGRATSCRSCRTAQADSTASRTACALRVQRRGVGLQR